jgi:general stress protein YciG
MDKIRSKKNFTHRFARKAGTVFIKEGWPTRPQTLKKRRSKMANSHKGNRGNNLSPEARSKGGSNSPGNFKNDPGRAAEAGRKGGQSRGSHQ